METIIIEVSDGKATATVLQPNIDIVIIDWDDAQAGYCAFCGGESMTRQEIVFGMHDACREQYHVLKNKLKFTTGRIPREEKG